MQGVGQRHVAVAMMMAVGFAVGGDMDELIPVAAVVNALSEPVREAFAAGQQLLEGDRLRDGRVVEEQGDRAARRQVYAGKAAWDRFARR